MPNEILSLSVTFAACKLTVMINGFPVLQESSTAASNQQYPVNQYLVSGRNELTLRIEPAPPLGIMEISEAQVRGTLKVFEEGQIVTPEDGEKLQLHPQDGESIQELDITAALTKQIDPTQPLELRYRFDCSIADFTHRFLEGAVIENEAEVIAYAEKLRAILAEKNQAAFIEETAIKVSDQAQAYSQGEGEFRQMFAETVIPDYFSKPFQLDWQADDLELVPWCGGRFYEIKVMGTSILDNVRDPQGGWMSMPCFVALVDGELRVVR